MQVVDKKTLLEFCESHNGLRLSANRWLDVVDSGWWLTPNDLKMTIPTASLIDSHRVVFNLKGDHYLLLTEVFYSRQVAASGASGPTRNTRNRNCNNDRTGYSQSNQY
ncbi:type II toxin-antitoxin system HigB family toxin [Bacteroidota bacterium]